MDLESARRLVPGSVGRYCNHWCQYDANTGTNYATYVAVVLRTSERGGVLLHLINEDTSLEGEETGARRHQKWVSYNHLLPDDEAVVYPGKANAKAVIRALARGTPWSELSFMDLPPDPVAPPVVELTPEKYAELCLERGVEPLIWRDKHLTELGSSAAERPIHTDPDTGEEYYIRPNAMKMPLEPDMNDRWAELFEGDDGLVLDEELSHV